MITTIEALNAIFSKSQKVTIKLTGYESSIFYLLNGSPVCENNAIGICDGFTLERLYHHFENMIRQGAELVISA